MLRLIDKEIIILENFLWSFITMLQSIDMEIITCILKNFAISEMKEQSFSFKMVYYLFEKNRI